MTNLFILERPDSVWGDYSDTLIHGHSGRDIFTGALRLERTGPYIPPISFPGLNDIVVTDELRLRLEQSGLTGFTFSPVVKYRIVNLAWEKWDRMLDEPKVYPRSGEPEHYIIGRKHSQKVASEMPELWELKVQQSAHVQVVKDPDNLINVELFFLLDTWNGDNIVQAPEVLYTYVDETAKAWFQNVVPEHISFRNAQVKQNAPLTVDTSRLF